MILLTHRPRFDGPLQALRRRGLPARGPASVAASLQRGLDELGLPFALNPKRLGSESGSVGVLSDIRALRAAIGWKRAKADRRLVAGPNLVVLPSDAGQIITCPEVDLVLVPSPWVKNLYELEAPELVGRVAVWASGVDASYWAPSSDTCRLSRGGANPHALVYVKQVPGQPCAPADDIHEALAALELAGFSHEQIAYGSYRPDDFLAALQRSDLMVAFSASESQGVALLEAWSADVPTLVRTLGKATISGRTFETSSAPYLSAATGEEFRSSSELAELLSLFGQSVREPFRPREWVLARMTDSHAAKRYWDLAHGAVQPQSTDSLAGLR